MEKVEDQAPARLVKISQLPIYSQQERVYEYQPRNIPAAVTTFRKFGCSVVTFNRECADSVKHVYTTGAEHTKSTLDYLWSEPASVQRVGVITLAALTGVVASFRKKPFTRVMYGSLLGGTAASVCYPKETVKMLDSTYGTARGHVTNYWEQYKPGSLYKPQTTAKETAPEYYETSQTATDSAPETVPATEAAPTKNAPEEDKGMGKDDESFMYTTRK